MFSKDRCLIIGEVAQAHDGSLGMAHAFIDAVASAGADAVKFQTHIAEAELTRDEPWYVRFSQQDATFYDYWKRTEFTDKQWFGLKQHADTRGLLFLSSPFSNEAVDFLKRVGVAAWRVPSGEMANAWMLEHMAATGLPIILSTGMSPIGEIDVAVERIQSHELPLAVLQSTSVYPCPPEKVGLNLISDFRNRYGCAVGLSDHSGTIYPGLAAAALGIEVLEVHITLSRGMFGLNTPASITTSELRQLVEGVRFVEKMVAGRVEKDAVAKELASIRSQATKNIMVRYDLPAGTVLETKHLTAKKPASGFPPDRFSYVLYRRLKRNVTANTPLKEDDLEE